MRIGFFTDTYTPQVNGVVSSINIFKKALEKRGHEVFIFAPAVSGYKEREEEKSKIFRFKSFKFVFHPEYRVAILPPFPRAFKRILDLKLDIVHAHTPFSMGVLALIVAKIQNLPLVYTDHSLYPELAKSFVLNEEVITPKIAKKITAFYCNRCQAVITLSPKMEYLLKQWRVKRKIITLPHGIDLDNFNSVSHNDFRQRYKIPVNAKVLIYVGRLSNDKNVKFLIRATKIISQKIKDVHLVLVGDGPHRDEILSLVDKLDLKSRTTWTGYLERPDVIKGYLASDLFVFASRIETQGFVILEAAAAGLPIVALQDKVFRDLAFKNILIDSVNGYLTPENLEMFTQKIIQILIDPQRYKKMSKNSREIARRFTISEQTQKLLTLYQSLI